jgi:DNA-binding NarL/FixJ family response regulator
MDERFVPVEVGVPPHTRDRAAAGPRSGPSGPLGVAVRMLSRREHEVALLVAQGLNNLAIATSLFVSRATVAGHVTNILDKLGFTSRVQIAVWVVERRVRGEIGRSV